MPQRTSPHSAFAALLLTVLLALLASALPARAAPGDEFWWDGFGLPDLDGVVGCATEFQGSWVIGGRFTLIGGLEVQNIARWDGMAWSPLGAGFDGEVLSLTVYGGELVASGRFDHSGTTALRGIARWNGEAWSPLGGGLWLQQVTSSVGASALASQGGMLYAAGDFDRAGGVFVRRVARWNGADWSALGEGLNGRAQSLLAVAESLYVGGQFDSAGTVPASGVALWDGDSWSALGSGLSYAFGGPEVLDMVRYRGALIAAGRFDSAGAQPAHNVAAWNGQLWRPLSDLSSNGVGETANALAVVGDTLLVAGYGLHAWDGSTWSLSSPYAAGLMTTLSQTPWGLGVGGRFIGFGPGGGYAAVNVGIIRDGVWIDPSSWNDRMHGLGGFGEPWVSALGSYGAGIVASGHFSYAGGTIGRISLGSVARWDGESWSTQGTPPYGTTNCFLATGDTLYARGSYASYPSPSTTPVMMFDGANWSALDTLSLWATSLALYRGTLYAGGRNQSSSTRITPGLSRWDGIRWESVGSPSGASDGYPGVNALLEYSGRLIVAGAFDSIAGMPARGLAAWDGVSWSAMASGLARVNATSLAECGGSLYAGGEFYDEENREASVVRWDGSRWKGVSSPRMLPYVLGCANGRLIAGGYFQRGIMSWDGQGWSSLGTGTNGPVLAMAQQDGYLYVGGHFSRAGDHSSSAIARWDVGEERRTSAILAAGSGVPNPFRSFTSIAYRLAAAGRVRVSVYDLRGRRVATLEDAPREAGTHFVTWDGHDEGRRDAPAGVYFFRLELPGRSETRRVVRLR